MTMWHVILIIPSTCSMLADVRDLRRLLPHFLSGFDVINAFKQSRDTTQTPMFIMKLIPQSSSTMFVLRANGNQN